MAGSRMARTFLPIALAFAAGCLPSGRIVARLSGAGAIESLGDGKPGASNVFHTVGPVPGAAVLALDCLKALLPAAALRPCGASENTVAAAAVAPVVAHVMVVGGQGVAATMGAGFAIDPTATSLVLVPVVGGTVVGYHVQSVLGAALALPFVCAIHRKGSGWRAAGLPVILVATRLRGRPGSGLPPSAGVALSRLLRDNDG